MQTPTHPLPKATEQYLLYRTPEGQRNKALFDAAQQFRDAGFSYDEACAQLESCAERDGLKRGEATAAIRSAYNAQAREPIRGKTDRQLGARRPFASAAKKEKPAAPLRVDLEAKPKAVTDVEFGFPPALQDGFRQLLLSAFKEGELVGITQGAMGDDGKDHPSDRGNTFPREVILKKLEENKGQPNKIWSSSDGAGLLVRINPMQAEGYTDADVSSYRHVLIEFDKLELSKQWLVIEQSKLPVSAVVFTGGKSLHAWVRVDAADRREYDERVAFIFASLEPYGLDIANKNPSRHSRVPGAQRGGAVQELVALAMGEKDFTTWKDWHELEAEISEPITLTELAEFRSSADPHNVIGQRFLCEGGSCMIIGQSGIGKSAFNIQTMFSFALGNTPLGIESFLQPRGKLKQLCIQNENDKGDMAEAFQGVARGLGFDIFNAEAMADIQERLIFHRDTNHMGSEFLRILGRLIDRYRPDLCWIDPLSAFAGFDLSDQEKTCAFLYGGLNSIAEATGVIWMIVHHTPKPKDSKTVNSWSHSDFAYAGAGCAALTNWPRAILNIQAVKGADGIYALRVAKRWQRTGLRDAENAPVKMLHMRHSTKGICWEYASDYQPQDVKAKPGGQWFESYVDVCKAITRPMTQAEICKILQEKTGSPRSYCYKKHWNAFKAFIYLTADQERYMPSARPGEADDNPPA